jgi:hypothetical protein
MYIDRNKDGCIIFDGIVVRKRGCVSVDKLNVKPRKARKE